jgi:hypothetical protein
MDISTGVRACRPGYSRVSGLNRRLLFGDVPKRVEDCAAWRLARDRFIVKKRRVGLDFERRIQGADGYYNHEQTDMIDI